MKLWWVHNEAMVAMLMAFVETKDPAYWQRFVGVRADDQCRPRAPADTRLVVGRRVVFEAICGRWNTSHARGRLNMSGSRC